MARHKLSFRFRIVLTITLVYLTPTSMADDPCIWCTPRLTRNFLFCYTDEIQSLSGISDNFLSAMKSSLIAASNAIKVSDPAIKSNMMNGAFAGQIASLCKTVNCEDTNYELIAIAGMCYETITGYTRHRFTGVLKNTVNSMLQESRTSDKSEMLESQIPRFQALTGPGDRYRYSNNRPLPPRQREILSPLQTIKNYQHEYRNNRLREKNANVGEHFSAQQDFSSSEMEPARSPVTRPLNLPGGILTLEPKEKASISNPIRDGNTHLNMNQDDIPRDTAGTFQNIAVPNLTKKYQRPPKARQNRQPVYKAIRESKQNVQQDEFRNLYMDERILKHRSKYPEENPPTPIHQSNVAKENTFSGGPQMKYDLYSNRNSPPALLTSASSSSSPSVVSSGFQNTDRHRNTESRVIFKRQRPAPRDVEKALIFNKIILTMLYNSPDFTRILRKDIHKYNPVFQLEDALTECGDFKFSFEVAKAWNAMLKSFLKQTYGERFWKIFERKMTIQLYNRGLIDERDTKRQAICIGNAILRQLKAMPKVPFESKTSPAFSLDSLLASTETRNDDDTIIQKSSTTDIQTNRKFIEPYPLRNIYLPQGMHPIPNKRKTPRRISGEESLSKSLASSSRSIIPKPKGTNIKGNEKTKLNNMSNNFNKMANSNPYKLKPSISFYKYTKNLIFCYINSASSEERIEILMKLISSCIKNGKFDYKLLNIYLSTLTKYVQKQHPKSGLLEALSYVLKEFLIACTQILTNSLPHSFESNKSQNEPRNFKNAYIYNSQNKKVSKTQNRKVHDRQNIDMPYLERPALGIVGLPRMKNGKVHVTQHVELPHMPYPGMPGIKDVRVPNIQNIGLPDKPYLGIPNIQNAGVSNIQNARFPNIQNVGVPYKPYLEMPGMEAGIPNIQNAGVYNNQNAGVHNMQHEGVFGMQNIKVPIMQNARVADMKNTRIPNTQNANLYSIQNTGMPAIPNAGGTNFGNERMPDIQNVGVPGMQNVGVPGIPNIGVPGIENKNWPNNPNTKVPNIQNGKVPDTQNAEFPGMKHVGVSNIENLAMPSMKNAELSFIQNIKVPKTENAGFPVMENTKLPNMHNTALQSMQNANVLGFQNTNTNFPNKKYQNLQIQEISNSQNIKRPYLQGNAPKLHFSNLPPLERTYARNTNLLSGFLKQSEQNFFGEQLNKYNSDNPYLVSPSGKEPLYNNPTSQQHLLSAEKTKFNKGNFWNVFPQGGNTGQHIPMTGKK